MSDEPAPPRRRGRLRPRTLRGRLVAVLALVLTLGFAAAALVTVLVVRHVLIDRLDASLRAAGDRFAVGLEHNDRDTDNSSSTFGSVEGQLAGTLGARVLNGQVTDAAIVGDHNTSDQLPAAARARLAGLTVDTRPHSISLPGLGTYRITVAQGRDNDLQVTGLPAGPVEQTIDKLVFIEAIVFAATLLIVTLSSAGLVRLMLRPLSRMAGTAADVSALPLDSGGVSLPHRVSTDPHGKEIDALAGAFNAMLTQVESALVTRADSEDRLRRFIADASHELRTPVAVVRSHAELAARAGAAARGSGQELPDEISHSLERIIAQAARMGHLVEDLLLLARLDSGRALPHADVDVTRIVLDAVDDIRPTAAEHRWRLKLPAHSLWIEGDDHTLAQAVSNLLANAATHTPAGSTVTVTVDAAPATDATDNVVQITVVDDGTGMSAELAEHAFDRFVRGDHTRIPGRGSSGLGLPIVAAIIDAHGGTIELRSDPTGTLVRLTLPAGTAEPDPGPEARDVAGDLEGDETDSHESGRPQPVP